MLQSLRIKLNCCICCVILGCSSYAQLPVNKSDFERLFEQDSLLAAVFNNSEYRVQICYNKLSDDRIHPAVQMGEPLYFYPASIVKLPIAILTLTKLEELNLSIHDRLEIIDSIPCQNNSYIKVLAEERPTFKTLIEEMLVVSDNNAYNALYQFVTPEYGYHEFRRIGLNSVKLFKSFAACAPIELCTNPIRVYDSLENLIFQSPTNCWEIAPVELYGTDFDSSKLIGIWHESAGKIVDGPFDFNYNLEFSLSDLNEMVLRLVVPDQYPENETWKLNAAQRSFVLRSMEMLPQELKNVKYNDPQTYPNEKYKYYYNPYLKDHTEKLISHSKLGLSYGFTTEVAHVLKSDRTEGYVISVSLYTNSNGIVNDGNYEYESTARSFVSRLHYFLMTNFD